MIKAYRGKPCPVVMVPALREQRRQRSVVLSALRRGEASLETAKEFHRQRAELLERGLDLGLSLREMAEAAGVQKGTYEVVLHRARKGR